jgi:DNA-binding HxlR family transcriptional regulator
MLKETQTDLDLKNKILNELMFKESTTYGELEKITDNHNLFNYHLKELQTKGLIEKQGKRYALSLEGRKVVALMEEDGKYQKQIKVSMFIDIIREVDGKHQMLLYKRLKTSTLWFYWCRYREIKMG